MWRVIMEDKNGLDYSALLLSLIVGVSVSASYIAIFKSGIVSFSLFPLICAVLAIYCLHQRYLTSEMPNGVAGLTVASAILGFLLYNIFIRIEYPQLGSNLLQTFICLTLVFWLMIKIDRNKKTGNPDTN